MPTYKEEAVVLRAYDLGEADRILAMITAGRGLCRAVAKGVKRTSSKFGARLEPFTHLNAVLHEGRNLDTVVHAETIRSHAPIREDYDKYLFGEAILEMIEKSMHESEGIPHLFDALRTSLDVLEQGVLNPALFLAAFELKVCSLIGYQPQLERCLHCGREGAGGNVSLDLEGGGIVCPECSRTLQNCIRLSPQAADLMRKLLKGSMADISGWDDSPGVSREILITSFRYSESFLDRPLKSRRIVLRYLDEQTDPSRFLDRDEVPANRKGAAHSNQGGPARDR